jgi:hypothetical protein
LPGVLGRTYGCGVRQVSGVRGALSVGVELLVAVRSKVSIGLVRDMRDLHGGDPKISRQRCGRATPMMAGGHLRLGRSTPLPLDVLRTQLRDPAAIVRA